MVVNLPAYLTGPEQWKVFWTFNADRGADLGSVWLVVAAGRPTTPSRSAAHDQRGVLGLLRRLVPRRRWRSASPAPATPRLAQLGFLVVAGFLLVNKVYSPQYVLWLLPLAVLARPRWRDLLIWQAGEVLYFATVWWYLGGYLAPGGRRRRRLLLGRRSWSGCGRALPGGVVVRDILLPRTTRSRDRRHRRVRCDAEPTLELEAC